MTRYGLLCLLCGALAWGQAAPQKSTPATQAPAPTSAPKPASPAAAAEQPKAAEVPPNTTVITINGVCEKPPADKTAAAGCKYTITRAEFEKVVDAVQPNLPPRARRQFATRYADALVMSKKAEEMGLENTPAFNERMKLARIQVLSQELGKALQEKAGQISDKDIEDYYHKNVATFEEADMDRIYVPKNKELPDADLDKAEDKKLTEAEEQKRQQEDEKREKESEAAMKAEADKLHARAVAGEDFKKLQDDAFEAAGIKTGSPSPNVPKMRRSMLSASQVSVMDLKAGEVSAVITDTNGFFIYKVKTKETMPLDQAREEIKNTLRSQRMQDSMKAVQESATPIYDENYFGPEAASRGPGAPRPGMPLPPIKHPATGPK
jgi:hypothetical protein